MRWRPTRRRGWRTLSSWLRVIAGIIGRRNGLKSKIMNANTRDALIELTKAIDCLTAYVLNPEAKDRIAIQKATEKVRYALEKDETIL